ncbi:MAG: ribonuclease HII [Clostridia bacterium]|nr:ribonuclease HII [Clostridia bacterium]
MNPVDALQYLASLDESDKYVKLREKLKIEYKRLKDMRKFEEQVLAHGFAYPAGLDEAGRGPLAGPVVAAAVILPPDYMVYGLNDSKKLSEKRRNLLYKIITRDAVAFAIKQIDNVEIDRINILEATKKAMLQCVLDLETMPDYLLVDAVGIEGTDIRQAGIINGDGRSVSIAAASVLAKVYRDSIMYEYDSIYPEYGFCRHKGYGTPEHIAALRKYGPVKIHRRSFIKNIV